MPYYTPPMTSLSPDTPELTGEIPSASVSLCLLAPSPSSPEMAVQEPVVMSDCFCFVIMSGGWLAKSEAHQARKGSPLKEIYDCQMEVERGNREKEASEWVIHFEDDL